MLKERVTDKNFVWPIKFSSLSAILADGFQTRICRTEKGQRSLRSKFTLYLLLHHQMELLFRMRQTPETMDMSATIKNLGIVSCKFDDRKSGSQVN